MAVALAGFSHAEKRSYRKFIFAAAGMPFTNLDSSGLGLTKLPNLGERAYNTNLR